MLMQIPFGDHFQNKSHEQKDSVLGVCGLLLTTYYEKLKASACSMLHVFV